MSSRDKLVHAKMLRELGVREAGNVGLPACPLPRPLPPVEPAAAASPSSAPSRSGGPLSLQRSASVEVSRSTSRRSSSLFLTALPPSTLSAADDERSAPPPAAAAAAGEGPPSPPDSDHEEPLYGRTRPAATRVAASAAPAAASPLWEAAGPAAALFASDLLGGGGDDDPLPVGAPSAPPAPAAHSPPRSPPHPQPARVSEAAAARVDVTQTGAVRWAAALAARSLPAAGGSGGGGEPAVDPHEQILAELIGDLSPAPRAAGTSTPTPTPSPRRPPPPACPPPRVCLEAGGAPAPPDFVPRHLTPEGQAANAFAVAAAAASLPPWEGRRPTVEVTANNAAFATYGAYFGAVRRVVARRGQAAGGMESLRDLPPALARSSTPARRPRDPRGPVVTGDPDN